ncbi:MAG: hypothetical protein HYZ85_02020 [Candidatus Omnitrophica bacterium]|nr:hypothetical protein [Candidatus Omnitrophota bacterium]
MQKVKSTGIPEDVRKQVDETVRRFNESWLKDSGCSYQARYEGKYLYLDRKEPVGTASICRLKYTGKMDDWEFAIYKYRSDRYDSDEWFFPGMDCVDGTIEGAMNAGLEAYPVHGSSNLFAKMLNGFKRIAWVANERT